MTIDYQDIQHADTPVWEAHYCYVGSHSDIENGENSVYVYTCCKKDALRKLNEAISILEFIVRLKPDDDREILLSQLKDIREGLTISFRSSSKEKCFTGKKGEKGKKE